MFENACYATETNRERIAYCSPGWLQLAHFDLIAIKFSYYRLKDCFKNELMSHKALPFLFGGKSKGSIFFWILALPRYGYFLRSFGGQSALYFK